jgi:sugar phosphate isomerase/epimerase
MKLGYCTGAFSEKPLCEVIRLAAQYGYEAVQIPAYRRATQFKAVDAISGKNVQEIKQTLKETGVVVSALTCHEDSMLLMGPYGVETDHICKGTPEEKLKFGMTSLIETAQAANALGVPVVVGFTGIDNWAHYYPFPYRQGWSDSEKLFAERMLPLLDKFKEYGVKYAIEPNPVNFIYDIHTAERAIELVDNHPNLGFNLDPANLMYLGLRVENFIDRLGKRIFTVHAKDGEVVAHNIQVGGILMNGSWGRLDRAYRFRVPGWGDVPWRKVITELAMVGYTGSLDYEHEDITMSREDGLKKVIHFLQPLLIENPYEGPWR